MFGRKKSPKREMPYETRKRRYGKVTSKYPKKYTQKQWNKFSPNIQQELTNRYNVIITDYKTRNEKIKIFGGKVRKGVSKGLASIEMEQNKMSKKKYTGPNYLDQSVKIKSPDNLGMFDMGFKKKKSTKNGYFDSLAKF